MPDLTHYIDLLKAVACVVVPVVIWCVVKFWNVRI